MIERLRETVSAVTAQRAVQAGVGVILGSGLGAFAGALDDRRVIPFEELPHFPRPGVSGHSGNLVIGKAQGVEVVALQGRVHFYEGFTLAEVTFPVRLLGMLGVRRLVVTNAAGGINPAFHPGDLMLITDHINLMGGNPLIGPNRPELGERFPDMSEAYDGAMRKLAAEAAERLVIRLRQGVYAAMTGPSYETPAEIRMCRALGADAVGMSTVPEVIVANQLGMRVLGISCITNLAAGILPQRLTHQEVTETAARVQQQFVSLLHAVVARLPSLRATAGEER